MAYKLMNAHLNPRIQCVPLRSDEEPELVYIKVAEGLEFAFDPNSMALLQIDGIDDFIDLRRNPPNPYIMARYKPNFQRGTGEPKVRSLVLEACHDCNLACSYPLSGDTLVPLLDGRTLRLHDIPEDEDTWVYSTHEGRVIPVLARRVLSSPKARRVKIRIQDRDGNIKAITGEPTHDMMLSDGSVRELGQLSPGDSLMPFYRELGSLEMDERLSGYERVQDPGTGDWCWTHRRLAETCDIAGLVFADNEYEICENPDIREVVHHYSGEAGNIFNKRNNRPDCLFWMSWANHSALHAYACFQSNEFWTEERRKRMADFQRERRNRDWQNPEYRARQLEVRRKNWQNGVGDAVNEGRDKANADPNHRRRVNKSISEGHLNAAPKVQRAKKSRMSLVGNLRAMKSRGEIPQSMTFGELEGLAIHIEPYKTYKSGIVEGNPCSFIEFAESRESHKPQPAAVNGNHVVLSVEKVEPGPVHCLICDHESHNFAVIGEPDVEYEYDAVRGATIDNEPVAFSGVFTFQCFVRNYYADHGTGNYMTFDTARSAIDRLLDPRQKLSVGFFGGEPMLNMKLIKEVTAYAENLAVQSGPVCKICGGSRLNRGEQCKGCRGLGKQPPSLHVTTNGTLYSEENLRFLEEHGYSLITSIDGTSEAHDALRPMKRSGKGSHKQILAGLQRMKHIAPGLTKSNTLRSTFSALRGETIRQRLEFLNQICDDGQASWVSVEPAAMSENTCFIPNQDELEIHVGNVWDRFYDEYMDTADWWIERAKAGKAPRFHNIHKSLERIFWCVHSGTECFSGDTSVSLLDGTERQMESIVGENHWFYSHYEGRVIPTQGRVVKTGQRELLEVELDNGEKLRVTPDHEWMLRDGSYLRTDQLQPGESLMPLYRKVGDGRWSDYEMLYDPGFDSWEFTHRRTADWATTGAVLDDSGSLIFGSRIEGQTVRHHVNFDSRDNRPENLAWMTWDDHLNFHAIGQAAVGSRVMNALWKTKDFQQLRAVVARETMQAQLDDPDSAMNAYLQGSRHAANNRKKVRQQLDDPNSKLNQWIRSEACNEHRRKNARRASKAAQKSPLMRETAARLITERNKSNEARARSSWHMKAVHAWKRYLKEHGLSRSEYPLAKFKKEHCEQFVLNHKVVAVRRTGAVEDTYCVQVDHECHNFALTAGVFVHNCGAGAGYASVNAKGEIFGCHRESNSYLGTLITGIDPKLRQPWLDNRIYTRTGCMNCGHRYACFSGDTEVSLLDGSEKSFADLAGKGIFDFYSFDNDFCSIVPTKGDVILTGRNRKLLEVELDNGEKIRVTPDHEWMLRDGSYLRTDRLQPGESLMPLYRRRSIRSRDGDVDGYEQFWQPESQEWEFTHRAVSDTVELGAVYDRGARSLILCERRADQKTRHHLNHNPLDNRPENLVWMTWQDHSAYHSDFASAGWSDSRRESLSEQQRMLASQGRHAFQVITDKMLDARRANAAETAARLLEEGRHPFIRWTQTEEHRQRSRERITKLNKTAAARKRSGDKLREWNAANHDRINRTPVECPDCGRMIGNRAALGKHRKSCKGVPANNHKVVAVRPVPGLHDVYCARIQHDSHNFALTAGVFVHNCGGGCREDSLGDKGNIHEPSNVHCALKEMWIRSAIKVMASLPKKTIAQFCREPKQVQNRKLYNFIPETEMPRDTSGIAVQKWVENIPIAALVRDGIDPTGDVPVLRDAPQDQVVVDTAYNPAGPVELSPAVQMALR